MGCLRCLPRGPPWRDSKCRAARMSMQDRECDWLLRARGYCSCPSRKRCQRDSARRPPVQSRPTCTYGVMSIETCWRRASRGTLRTSCSTTSRTTGGAASRRTFSSNLQHVFEADITQAHPRVALPSAAILGSGQAASAPLRDGLFAAGYWRCGKRVLKEACTQRDDASTVFESLSTRAICSILWLWHPSGPRAHACDDHVGSYAWMRCCYDIRGSVFSKPLVAPLTLQMSSSPPVEPLLPYATTAPLQACSPCEIACAN